MKSIVTVPINSTNHFNLTPANSPSFSSDVPFAGGSNGTVTTYSYAGTGYTNPHAPTAIGNTSTTTYSYDNNGNLTSAGAWTYTWDYRNRITSAGNGLATSTYGYDHTGQRVKVFDGSTSHTTLYPSKYYNAEYDNSSNLTKQTSHTFSGDTLLSTLETNTLTFENQGTCSIPASGDFTLTSSCTIAGDVIAPGSVIVPSGKVLTVNADSTLLIDFKHYKLLVRKGGGTLIKKGGVVRQIKASDTAPQLYYHLTDHLGSVAVSTNNQGTITELSDYLPYGSVRFDTKNGLTEQRKYIGQEYDAATSLNYLNARYYDGNRGQFLSEDLVFWEVGMTRDGKAALSNPQSMNSYSYAGNNPITMSDPTGRWYRELITGQQSWSSFYGEIGQAANQMGQDNPGWNFAMNHPYATGAITAALSYPALQSGLASGVAFKAAGDVGVGTAYAVKQIFAGLIYSMLTYGTTAGTIPGTINDIANVNLSKPSTALSWGTSFAWNVGPSLAGEYVGAFSDAIQLGGMISKSLGSAATNLFSNSIQTRTSAVNSFNSSIGGTGSSQPSNNSLWVTPSGAIVNWGGQLVSGPVKK